MKKITSIISGTVIALCLIGITVIGINNNYKHENTKIPINNAIDNSFQSIYDYKELKHPIKNAKQITEIFWLACPHCKQLSPLITKLEEKYELERIHSIASKDWFVEARLFYAIKYYDQENKTNIMNDVFNFYQSSDKIKTLDEIYSFLKEKNIEKDLFIKIADGDWVNEKLRQSLEITIPNELNAVPVIIINGKYVLKFSENVKTFDDAYNYIVGFIDFVKTQNL